jgi:hypothetical protein
MRFSARRQAKDETMDWIAFEQKWPAQQTGLAA